MSCAKIGNVMQNYPWCGPLKPFNRERSDGPAISVSSTDGRAVDARTQCLHYTCSVLKKRN